MKILFDPWMENIEDSEPVFEEITELLLPGISCWLTMDKHRELFLHLELVKIEKQLAFNVMNANASMLFMHVGKKLNISASLQGRYIGMKTTLLAVRGNFVVFEKPQVLFAFAKNQKKNTDAEKKIKSLANEGGSASTEKPLEDPHGVLSSDVVKRALQDIENDAGKDFPELKTRANQRKSPFGGFRQIDFAVSVLNLYGMMDRDLSADSKFHSQVSDTQRDKLLRGFNENKEMVAFLPEISKYFSAVFAKSGAEDFKVTIPKLIPADLSDKFSFNLFYVSSGNVYGFNVSASSDSVEGGAENTFPVTLNSGMIKFQRREFLRVIVKDPSSLSAKVITETDEMPVDLLDIGPGGAGILVTDSKFDLSELAAQSDELSLELKIDEQESLRIESKLVNVESDESGLRVGLKFSDNLQVSTTTQLQEFVFDLQREQLKSTKD